MFEYPAELVRIVDGDTLDAEIDLGFGVFVKKRVSASKPRAWQVWQSAWKHHS